MAAGSLVTDTRYTGMNAPRMYNEGTVDKASSVDLTTGTDLAGTEQLSPFYYYKRALVDLVKEQYFMPLADVRAMPKHMGQSIKQYHYLPLLDDRNKNDQGIDASGAKIANGNLWGSSKDIGTITGKLPAVGEQGGRVNRVGFSRKTIQATIHKMGFFDEYTQDSLDFDSDSQLEMHVTRESLRGANQITEAALQIDLLNGATVRWPAAAASLADMKEGATVADDTILTYGGIKKAEIYLNDMKCPKDTTIITGSRMIDTRTIGATRIMYIGSELQTLIEKMKDYHGNPAFIPKHQYYDAGSPINGEIGAIGNFRVVVVPEMLRDEGKGAASTTNTRGYADSGSKFNVAYALIVGSGSFTSIGFQTNGKAVKFKIYHKRPGEGMVSRDDPYGEIGLHSIKWWYGTMILRKEWLLKLPSLYTL